MAAPESFDTSWPGAPDEISLGFVTVTGLQNWPGRFYYQIREDKQQTFRLEESAADGNLGSMIWVHMDIRDRPAEFGMFKTFAALVNFYRKKAAPFTLAQGQPFHAGMLALPVPKGWEHEAFQVPSGSGSGGTIVHTYVGDGHCLLIRYVSRDADLADRPRFLGFNVGLSMHPGRWTSLDDYIDVPQPPELLATAGPLSSEVLAEVTKACERATSRLGLPVDAAAGTCQDAISEYVNSWIFGDAAKGGDDVEDVAVDLGCLYGQSLCETLGWKWCEVFREGVSTFAVASPDRAVFVPPMIYLQPLSFGTAFTVRSDH